MEAIESAQAPAAVGPYSQAIRAGKWLYISGQIPLNSDGNLVEGDITAQTQQVMENLEAILEAAGLDFSDVVKAEVFLTDMNEFAAFNEVYASYFHPPYPARWAVGVVALPRGARVEVALIARG